MTASPGEEARFLTRNAVDALPEGALEKQLGEGRPLRVKLGIDPTAPDIHLGHTVVLRKLREFQDRGHTVVLIIGDYTARVGDPSGRSSTRPELSGDEIDANAETFQKQAFLVLDRDRTEVRRNGEWLDMAMEDLFKLARTTTVAQLLERDDFAQRYAAHEPISILELLYPLLQGYDSVAIDADVEMGATDQKFNILLARDIQQAYGKTAQSILTMPILPGTDGKQKMSKSLGNHVGLTEPPDEVFGKLMRVPDEAMPVYYELLLDEPFDPAAPAVESKRRMAGLLTARLHGDEAGPQCGGALRPPPRRARDARRDRGPGGGSRRRLGPPPGRYQGRVRPLLIGGAPAADPGRSQARRRGARRRGSGRAGRPPGRPRASGGQAPFPAPANSLGTALLERYTARSRTRRPFSGASQRERPFLCGK